jgi:plastocyanin
MSQRLVGARGNRLLEAMRISSGRMQRGVRKATAFRFEAESLEDRTLLTTVTVNIVNFAFNPDPVTINVGDTIHWVWQASNHSTTSVKGDPETWDSGVHNTGFTFDHTFNTSGTYPYYCSIHGFDNGDGTAGGMSGTIIVNSSSATLTSIAVTPANPSVPKGETEQFIATGTYSDNSTKDLTSSVTWASATTSVATINSSGLATAVAQGTSAISAKLDGITGSTVMTVTPAVLQSIAVTPVNPSVPKGETEQFTATGSFSDKSTQDLTNSATWASSTTSVATISSTGLATAAAQGTSTISATLSGVSGSTIMTVSPAALLSIAVTPTNPSIAKGLTQQFTATGNFSDNTTQNLTSSVTWVSATTSVATITSGGLATGVATGTSNISATFSGVTGSTVLTVTPAALVSIAVSPANPSIAKGTTQQFAATGTYTDNSTQILTSSVTWVSATTSVATITSAGLATGVATGTSSISATLAGVTGSTVLTVSPASLVSIAVTPADPSIAKGLTQQFTATGTFSDNSTQNLTTSVTWASATTSVATINSTGLATAIATGTSTISATQSGVTGSTVLTVSPAALVSIAVTPTNPSIVKGTTQQFTATGTFTDNSTQNLTGSVTWASATTSIATINATGLASGIASGTSNISATFSGVTGSTVLTVTPAALVSIAVSPANPSIAKGLTQQFTATGTFSDNSTQNITGSVTWASAATSVATINTAGLATGLATGTSSISATLSGITGSTVLTVTPAALVSIVVTPANPSIAKGLTHQFTATGTFTDNSTQSLTNSVTWASATSSVATISNTGLVTAVATGSSSISATLGGVTGSTVLTVTPATLVSIAVTPTNPSIAKGTTQQFTATGTFTDNSTQSLTNSATWASATPTVATISATGLASGLAVGTTAITATLNGVTSPADTLTVTGANITVAAIAAEWGSQTATLQTAADGVRLLPTGRKKDLPWFNINKIAISLSQAAVVSAGDVSMVGLKGGNYGPVNIAGSGTSSIVITLAKSVAGPDLVTITIGNNQIVTYTRRLDILPGDVNDDAVVNTTDGVLILNNTTPTHAYNMFDDMNGDGSVNTTDFNLYRPNIGTTLPSPPPQLAAGGVGPGGAASITTSDVAPVLQEAIAEWADVGLPAQDLARLRGVTVEITDLPAGYLGITSIGSSTIELSRNADGFGWFSSTGALPAGRTPAASAGHEDLLTVVMHELGHTLGLADLNQASASSDLMAETLATGVRRLPSAANVANVEPIQDGASRLSTSALSEAPSPASVDAMLAAADDAPSSALPTWAMPSAKKASEGRNSLNDSSQGLRTSATRISVTYQVKKSTPGPRRSELGIFN